MSREALDAILALGPEIKPVKAPEIDPNHVISPIMYPEAYKDAMGYLRALMQATEYSPRALALTRYIIGMNAAHYTVWTYRADALFALDSDLHAELRFIDEMAEASSKNYQLWHHREVILSKLGRLPDGELDFLARVLDEDAKNYHVWTYRQWLVKRFDPAGELAYTALLIKRDIYNNSAWNHRYFLQERHKLQRAALEDEIAYVESIIDCDPENKSPWSYLRGLLKLHGRDERSIETYVKNDGEFERLDIASD